MRRASKSAGWTATLLACLFATGCADSVPRAELGAAIAALERPNLVLVLVDTLRADDMTPYGAAQDTSPEIARWASRGVLFERTRSQSSWTKISMASLLTSLWPRSHGIREAQDGLANEAQTLAESLQEAGYATYGVQTNGWLHQSFGFHQGFDRYSFPNTGGDKRLGRGSLWPHADRVVDEAKRLLAAHDRERPFFLYLHLMDVHEYAAPPHFKHFGTDSRGDYRAAIRWTDDAAKRVREVLEDEGLAAQSVLVFASDHGETFGEHGIHGHARNVLTPVVSVPLVFRFPFALAQGVRVPTQVRNIDIAPTLLELAGVTPPSRYEGESLLPLMQASESATDRPNFAALGVPLFGDASVQRATSNGSWTYARNALPPEDDAEAYEAKAVAPGAEFLFDRGIDPAENANLIELEAAQADAMRTALDAHLAEGDASFVEHGVRIDPAIAERLRAMGYLR